MIVFNWVSNISSNLVELDLSSNYLEGPIPDHFGIMMNLLERIELSYNRFNGAILKSFSNICTLHSLNLLENDLSEDLASIFHDLSSGCVRFSIQDLDLRHNQITGSLPDLSKFSLLKTLHLSRNYLSGKIPESTRLPSQLEYLSLRSNSLEGRIPKSFGDACTLRSLDLSNNSLSEELPVIIHDLSGCARYSLQQLDLSRNRIKSTLPNLSVFLSLKSLYLHENCLNGNISEDVRFPSQLEVLYIKSNSLKGVIIDSQFANMSKLKSLDLSENSLTLAFANKWVPSFSLHSLGLRSCKLGAAFPRWLQKQNNLQIVDISDCGISDIVPKWFWAKLGILRTGRLNMSYNNLHGLIPNLPLKNAYRRLSLASNLFEGRVPLFLRGSTNLDLSRNKFSDFRSFLCANGMAKTLAKLDLSNNHLLGQIPNCWTHFKSLVYLDLSHNNFSGKIPASIGSLFQLQALLLRNNNLTGEMPFSLSNCRQLVMLDVRENRLSGPIPSWIGSQLQGLQFLSLHGNDFSGSLPLPMCYLHNIQLLDLSANNLSGKIPKCFKNFTLMARKTSLTENPRHKYNFTTGPTIYSGAYDLNSILMWKGVQQVFINSEVMLLKSIDLSSNHLSGGIPQEIESLIELISLNLSRNNLTGNIPSGIGRLGSLEFLDLSRNQISGSIPYSLAKIDRLTMLDLSHNNLSGEIPTSTQLQSFDATSYEDNLDLCGKPLDKLCIEEKPHQNPADKCLSGEDSFFSRGFYISMTFGFVMGFWGSFGSILIKRSWRHAYFKFVDNLTNKISTMVAMKFTNRDYR
ncbi:hypothetical protein RJT34_19547 [Clitoria ternatea]|uniref:Non-specific serine/threonine protein kinase n=1 Tax=Clitoria ternatea TaxID=43366 RepID=A0AAN9P4S9_CLITE